MSNTSRNRRKRYIVLKRFQLRFIGTILFFILLTAFVTSIIMFKSMGAYLREALSNVYPQTEIVRIMRSVTIRIWLGVTVISIISVFFGVLASHKIAGPIYRIKRVLNELASGAYPERLQFRKGDELKDLADVLNRLINKLNKEKKS